MIDFKVKLLGNHWYPSISHYDGCLVGFNEKIDKFLNYFNYNHNQTDELTLEFEELGVIWEGVDGIIYFDENDMCRYFTTDDNFDLRFVINNHEFSISSDMYFWLEQVFDFNFHKTNYQIRIY